MFRGALMVTTFVCLAGNWTKGVWLLIEKASRADIRLEKMEHPTFQKNIIMLFG